jgi:hypothetical protein
MPLPGATGKQWRLIDVGLRMCDLDYSTLFVYLKAAALIRLERNRLGCFLSQDASEELALEAHNTMAVSLGIVPV